MPPSYYSDGLSLSGLPDVHVHFISGLNEPAAGPMLGLKNFGESMRVAADGRVSVGYATHTDNFYHDLPAAWFMYGTRLVLVGHSFGGDEAFRAAARITTTDSLFLLDPVPESGLFGLLRGHYLIPPHIRYARCWQRSWKSFPWLMVWSKRIGNPSDAWRNQIVDRSHNAIPGMISVHAAIGARVSWLLMAAQAARQSQ